MTEVAMKQSEIDYYVYSKKMTSRFYRAQGKRGRCLQDRQLHFFSVRTSKEYFEEQRDYRDRIRETVDA